MAYNESQRADLSKRRGAASAGIQDPEKKKKFIAQQGEVEKKYKNAVPDEEYERLSREADTTAAAGGQNVDFGLPSYKRGTAFVKETGLARLHRGERVVPAKENKKHWIAGAIKHPGSLRAAAKRKGESTRQFAKQHEHDSGKTGKRSRLALTLMKMH